MHVLPEIQFQISLLNIASQGEAQRQAEELEDLLAQQETSQKR
jgi:hypothetical protein